MSTSQTIRFGTGNAGLDQILHGGLLKHGIHVVAGLPGTGKTILTQQIGFTAAKQGHQVVTVTALAESHERLISHLESFEFFDPSLVGSKVYYLSASRIFIELGLLPSVNELRQLVSSPRAEILIFEGLSALASLAASTIEFRRFLFDLNAHLTLMSCMGLFIVDSPPDRPPLGPEYALADTALLLYQQEQNHRQVRKLQVIKSRGTEQTAGLHSFEITRQGFTAYPRLETQIPQDEPAIKSGQQGFDLPALDQLLAGGLPEQSTTALTGAAGTGKTLLGLQFIAAGARNNEPGLVWSFSETPSLLLRKASAAGIELPAAVSRGLVRLECRPSFELLLDKEYQHLLRLVLEHKVRRLLIDHLAPFQELARQSGRAFNLLLALGCSLRAQGVTTLVNIATSQPSSFELNLGDEALASAADNILALRSQEQQGQIRRQLTILKKREGEHSTRIHDFQIGAKGLEF